MLQYKVLSSISLKDYQPKGMVSVPDSPIYASSPVMTEDSCSNGDWFEVKGTASTNDLDRGNDVVLVEGIDLSNHKKNPLLLFCHDKKGIPLGRCSNPVNEEYSVKIEDGCLRFKGWIDQNSGGSWNVVKSVKSKVLRGVSIGFVPKKIALVEDQSGRQFTLIEESELVEISITPLPENQNALLDVYTKSFGLSEPLQQMYKDMLDKKLMPNIQDVALTNKSFGNNDADPGATANSGHHPNHPSNNDQQHDGNMSVKAGAQFLVGIYDILMMAAEFMTAGINMQEDPEIKEAAYDISEAMSGMADHIGTTFSTKFPELPALAGAFPKRACDPNQKPGIDGDDDFDDANVEGNGDEDGKPPEPSMNGKPPEDKPKFGDKKEGKDKPTGDKDGKPDEKKKPKFKKEDQEKIISTLREAVVAWNQKRLEEWSAKILGEPQQKAIKEAMRFLKDSINVRVWGRQHKELAYEHARKLHKVLKSKSFGEPEPKVPAASPDRERQIALLEKSLSDLAAKMKTLQGD